MLFKILHGDESRISTDITPFHEGYCYVTHNGNMYIDMNIGTEELPNNQRVQLNAKNAETLTGMTLDEIKEYVAVQPDWNQTDETKTDYIKNKPDINELIANQIGGLRFSIKENGILTISINEEE